MSPIIGMTTQHEPGRGLPRLGVIHKGAARTQQDIDRKRPGKDLNDQLRVEFAEEYAYLRPAWERLYGSVLPREIPGAYLLSAGADDAFSAWMEAWGASGLVHRCDGQTQIAWFDPSMGRVNRTEKPCERAQGCDCKQIGRINFFLPDFVRESGALGYFTLQTHAVTDITRIAALLKDIQAIPPFTLLGIPFIIGRRPETFEVAELKDGKLTGKRMNITKSVIHIRVDEHYTRVELAPRLLGGVSAPALVDTTTGEVLRSLPAPAAKPQPPTIHRWTEAEALAWSARIGKDYDISKADILKALGVTKLGEWQGNAETATARIDAWLDEVLAQPEGEEPDDAE